MNLTILWTFVSCFIDIQDDSNKFQQIIASWSVGCAPWYSEVPEAPPSLWGLPEDYVNAPGLCEAFAPAKSSFWVGRTEWKWWIACCWMMSAALVFQSSSPWWSWWLFQGHPWWKHQKTPWMFCLACLWGRCFFEHQREGDFLCLDYWGPNSKAHRRGKDMKAQLKTGLYISIVSPNWTGKISILYCDMKIHTYCHCPFF